MTISFKCGACGRSYKVDAKLSGKKAKCGCGQSMTVPAKPVAAPIPPPEESFGSTDFDPLGSLNQDDLFAATLPAPSASLPLAPMPSAPLASIPRPSAATSTSLQRKASAKKEIPPPYLKWAGIGGGAVVGLAIMAGLIVFVVKGLGSLASGESRPDALTFRGEMGQPRTTAEWLDVLRQQDSGKSTGILSRRQTSGIETWLGPDPAAIPDLFESLRTDKPGKRAHRVTETVLRRFESEHIKPLKSDLAAGLDDPHPEVQLWSVRLLRSYGVEGKEFIDKVTPHLKSGQPDSVSYAASTLIEMGDEGFGHVLETLKSSSGQKEVHTKLIAALRDSQGNIEPAIPSVLQLIGTGYNESRLALSCFKKWEGRAAQAVPELVTRLEKESDASLRQLISESLVAIKTGVPESLVPLFESSNDANRLEGLAIATTLESATAAAPFMDEFIKSENQKLKLAAVSALGLLGPACKPFLPQLTTLLKDPNRELAPASMQALAALGSHAGEVVPTVFELLNSSQLPNSTAVNQFLMANVESPARTAAELAGMVKWGEPPLVQAAITALKQRPAENNPEVAAILTEAKKRAEDRIKAWENQREIASRSEELVFRDRLGLERSFVYRSITAEDIRRGAGKFLTRDEFITRQQIAGYEGPIATRPVKVEPLDAATRAAPETIASLIERFK